MAKYLTSSPRIAWAMTYETGIRTQAAADLEEAGINIQTGGKKPSGGSHNDDYWPIYARIKRMEQENATLAAVGHWLCLNDTAGANQYLDDVHDTVLTRFVMLTPAWSEWRKARQDRVKAMIYARLMRERNNQAGDTPEWQPKEISAWTHAYLGVKFDTTNWKKCDWHVVWMTIGIIAQELENCAMEPIVETISLENKKIRNFMREAA